MQVRPKVLEIGPSIVQVGHAKPKVVEVRDYKIGQMGSIGLKVKQTETSVCIHNQQQLQSKKKKEKYCKRNKIALTITKVLGQERCKFNCSNK